jgi:hypothetical protein
MLAYIFIVTMIYIAFLLACCDYKFDQLRKVGAHFHYGIADFWAAMLGLTPTFLLVTYLIRSDFATFLPLVGLAVWILSQSAGVVLLRANYAALCARTHRRESAVLSALNVFLGATVCALALLIVASIFAIALLFVVSFH